MLKQEIERVFTVIKDKSTPEELVFICPEPGCGDRSGNRAVNLKTSKTFCWRCNKGKNNKGHFIAWARALGYTFDADAGYGNGTPLDELLYTQEEQSSIVPVLQEVALPEGFTPIARKPDSIYTRLIADMARRKNLDYQDFVEAGVGYTMDAPRWEAFAVFPVREYDFNVYYQGRTYIDKPGESTKLFPSRHEVKWGAGYWVYNINEVRERKPDVVVIVESILNVLSLKRKFKELRWKNVVPVCVFKHHISKVQVLKLLRCQGVQEFCLLFDHDAIDATWRMVGHMSNKVRVTVAEMPFRADNKKLDPNDDVTAACRALECRKLYTGGSAVSKILQQEKGLASREVELYTKRIKCGS